MADISKTADKNVKKMSPDTYNREAAGDFNVGFGGLVDPDRVLEKLGLDQYTAYRDILTDGNLTAVMGSRLAAVQKLEWDVVTDKASARVTKFIRNFFKETDFIDMPNFFNAIMLKNPYGMSTMQVDWGLWNNMMIPTKVEDRPARWFTFNEQNELRFMGLNAKMEGDKIKPRRILLARNNPTYDNPYGDKLLSKSYWPITFKRNAWKWEQVSIEKYAIPWIVTKYPGNWDEDKIDELMDKLSETVQDGIIGTPLENETSFLEASGSRSSDIYTNHDNRMNAEVQKIWLGQTLTTEITGDVGSYAASQTHAGVKDERRDQDSHEIQKVVNQLIRWMVDVNFGSAVPQPKFVMNEPETVDKTRAEVDKILWDMGVRWTKDHMKEEYNLNDNDFELKEDEPEQGAFPFSMGRFKDQNAVDKMVDKLTTDEKLQKQAAALLNPIIKMINKSKNFEEVERDLLKQWPKMSTKDAEEAIGSAMFIGELTGRISANEGK